MKILSRAYFLCFVVICLSWCATDARADDAPLIDHQPHRFGGFISDTSFLHPANGQPSTNTMADRFVLGGASAVRRVVWWGFEWYDNPPSQETFQIRVYNADGFDGLPGTLAADYVAASPTRIATGRDIAADTRPDEYRYQFDLPGALWANGNQPYWLEITQLGDVAHAFGWEYSIPAGYDGAAYSSPQTQGWVNIPTAPDLAFQLWSVPEPATLGLMAIGAWIARRRR